MSMVARLTARFEARLFVSLLFGSKSRNAAKIALVDTIFTQLPGRTPTDQVWYAKLHSAEL
jgi:hypothetical protein